MVRTTCSYCGVGCQLYLHVQEGKVVKVTGVEDVGPNYGSLCVKGRFGYDFIHDAARLKNPLIRENGRFGKPRGTRPSDVVAGRLDMSLKEAHGADAIGVSDAARASPMRRTTWPRSSPGPRSAPTMSITARGSDTLPPWPVWPQRLEAVP